MRRQESTYDGTGNLGGIGEQEIYDIMYSAFTAALDNNRLLREQKDMVKGILQKPTMEVSELGKSLARDSWIRGGNTGKGGMRLAVAQELY